MVSITPVDQLTTTKPRKYRILDDCARLRDIIEAYRKSEPRFKPSLAVITWAETDGLEAAPDFGDMVCISEVTMMRCLTRYQDQPAQNFRHHSRRPKPGRLVNGHPFRQ